MANLLVVLGAGSSFDAAPTGGASSPTAMPPLARDLFDPRFDDILARYPLADGLKHNLLSRVARGTGLETVLGDLSERAHSELRTQVAHIPPYLRALMGRTASDRPTVFDSLIQLIQEQGHSVCFITLNYDTLLEEALARKYRRSGTIEGFRDYAVAGRDWQLVKIHGSIDWGYTTDLVKPDSALITADELALLPDYLDLIDGNVETGRLVFLDSHTTLFRDKRLIYPALALPSDRKYGFVCPTEHISAASVAIHEASAAIVIGSQGLDVDLMEFLQQNSGGGTRSLTVVDPSEDGADIANRFRRALKVRDANVTSLSMGFSGFVEDGMAESIIASI